METNYRRSESPISLQTLFRFGRRHIIVVPVVFLFLLAVMAILVVIIFDRERTTREYKEEIQAEKRRFANTVDNVTTAVTPCNNFHAFVCNEESKEIMRDMYNTVDKEENDNYMKLYNEPIKPNDPDILKVHKNLFQTCVDENAIISHFLPTLEKIQTELGGWPVVIGDGWNADDFNWLETIYKTRELGYDSEVLFIPLIPDRDNKDLKVFISNVPPIYNTTWQTLIVAIAKMFGAEEDFALREIRQMAHFVTMLNDKMQNGGHTYIETTILEYQSQVEAIDWWEFINKIGNFKHGEILLNDTVKFSSVNDMSEWLKLIATIPKRVLANYMIWTAMLDALVPFARPALIHYGLSDILDSLTRDSHAIVEQPAICNLALRNRFDPNPLTIAYAKKYIPKEKTQEITELSNSIKSTLKNVVKNTAWINTNNKNSILKKITDVTLTIGIPEEIADYSLFNNMKFDEAQLESKNFFDVYRRTMKYHKDWRFTWIKKPLVTGFNWQGYTTQLKYFIKENIIAMSAMDTQFLFSDTNNSSYLNYARMGYYTYEVLSDLLDQMTYLFKLSPEARQNFVNKRNCVNKIMAPSQNELNGSPLALTFTHKVLNEIYNNYIRHNQDNTRTDTEYTAKQSFWISFYKYFCRHSEFNIMDAIPDLANDFHCKREEDTCKVFKV